MSDNIAAHRGKSKKRASSRDDLYGTFSKAAAIGVKSLLVKAEEALTEGTMKGWFEESRQPAETTRGGTEDVQRPMSPMGMSVPTLEDMSNLMSWGGTANGNGTTGATKEVQTGRSVIQADTRSATIQRDPVMEERDEPPSSSSDHGLATPKSGSVHTKGTGIQSRNSKASLAASKKSKKSAAGVGSVQQPKSTTSSSQQRGRSQTRRSQATSTHNAKQQPSSKRSWSLSSGPSRRSRSLSTGPGGRSRSRSLSSGPSRKHEPVNEPRSGSAVTSGRKRGKSTPSQAKNNQVKGTRRPPLPTRSRTLSNKRKFGQAKGKSTDKSATRQSQANSKRAIAATSATSATTISTSRRSRSRLPAKKGISRQNGKTRSDKDELSKSVSSRGGGVGAAMGAMWRRVKKPSQRKNKKAPTATTTTTRKEAKTAKTKQNKRAATSQAKGVRKPAQKKKGVATSSRGESKGGKLSSTKAVQRRKRASASKTTTGNGQRISSSSHHDRSTDPIPSVVRDKTSQRTKPIADTITMMKSDDSTVLEVVERYQMITDDPMSPVSSKKKKKKLPSVDADYGDDVSWLGTLTDSLVKSLQQSPRKRRSGSMSMAQYENDRLGDDTMPNRMSSKRLESAEEMLGAEYVTPITSFDMRQPDYVSVDLTIHSSSSTTSSSSISSDESGSATGSSDSEDDDDDDDTYAQSRQPHLRGAASSWTPEVVGAYLSRGGSRNSQRNEHYQSSTKASSRYLGKGGADQRASADYVNGGGGGGGGGNASIVDDDVNINSNNMNDNNVYVSNDDYVMMDREEDEDEEDVGGEEEEEVEVHEEGEEVELELEAEAEAEEPEWEEEQDVQEALDTFKKHAGRLNISEKELLEVVREDPTLLKSSTTLESYDSLEELWAQVGDVWSSMVNGVTGNFTSKGTRAASAGPCASSTVPPSNTAQTSANAAGGAGAGAAIPSTSGATTSSSKRSKASSQQQRRQQQQIPSTNSHRGKINRTQTPSTQGQRQQQQQSGFQAHTSLFGSSSNNNNHIATE